MKDAEKTKAELKTEPTTLPNIIAREQSGIKLEDAISLLRATLEATADGILAVDNSNRITNINRKFIEMFRLPESVAETRDFRMLLDHIIAEVKEPDSILENLKQMEENPGNVSRGLIEFKDGRIVERCSNPQRIGDEIVGTVCSFRDVTEQRQLVRDLNESLSRLSKKSRYESIIGSINRSVTVSDDLQDILDSVVDAVSENIEVSDIVSIYFVEGQYAVLRAYKGYPDWYIREAGRIPYPHGFTWKAIIENVPLLYCSDVDQDAVIGTAGRKLGTKSYVSMPFSREGKVIGTINIHSLKRNAFDEEELNLLGTVAQQIERAIKKIRMTEQLRQSEERYRVLFDQSPVGVYIFDKDLNVVHGNKRMIEILQTTYDNFIGFNIRDLNDKSFVPVMEATIRGEYSYREGFYEATTSEAKVWLSQYFSPLYDDKGDVIGGIGVAEDITERKLAAEALQKAKESLSEAQRIAHLGNWDWDIGTNEIRWSDEVYRIFGFTPQEFGGTYEAFLNSVHPDDRDFVRRSVDDALHEGSTYGLDHRIVLPDGSERIVHEQAEVIYGDNGHPVQMIGTVLDITERKHTEDALRSNERMLATVMSNLPGCSYRCRNDKNFTLEFVSEGISILTGYDVEDYIVNMSVDYVNLIHPDDRQRVIDEVKAAVENHRMYEFVYRITTREKKEKWVWEKGQGVYSLSGDLLFLEGFVTDITERKRLEAELRQAQKMEAIGRLAGGVAHDFNNLLTVVLNYSDLLLSRSNLDSTQEERIRVIRNAGERAAALTGQLLAFSRKQLLQPQVLDLDEVVTGIERMIRRLLGEDIELVIELEPGLGLVKADPGQLEQVIMNLAINAKDAMPKGGKLIIRTANVSPEEAMAIERADAEHGRYVMLSVSDSGHGMEEETLSQIFEPFYTTKELGKGTGLGLATVYGIINQSGGHITVDSEIDRGTTFKIYLPVSDEHPEQTKNNVVSAGSAKGGTETIIIAEDQDEVLSLVSSVLKEAGHNVLEANHCDKAILLCEQYKEPIHLLLADVVMPKMRGPELAQRLKALHPEMRVIYMSGYIDNSVSQYGALKNGKYFLQKPFTPAVLLRKVREVLDTPD